MFAKSFSAQKWLLVGLLLALATAFFPSAAKAYNEVDHADPRRLTVPGVIQVPSGRSLQEVKSAILKGLNGRRWNGKEIAPNLIEATYDRKGKGKVLLIVDIQYDTDQVRMTYKDSKNLRYQVVGDAQLINPRANAWMRNIASDINRFLKR